MPAQTERRTPSPAARCNKNQAGNLLLPLPPPFPATPVIIRDMVFRSQRTMSEPKVGEGAGLKAPSVRLTWMHKADG